MSENKDFDREAGEADLPALIVCGGMVLRVYDLEDKLRRAATEPVQLIKWESPFPFAEQVQQVHMAVQPGRTRDDKLGLLFHGCVTFDPPLSKRAMRDVFRVGLPNSIHNSSSRSIEIRSAGDCLAVRMEHVLGMQALMYADASSKYNRFVVSNNMREPVNDKIYKPLPLDAMEGRAQLTAFAGCLFHAVDYVAGLVSGDKDPAVHFVLGTVNLGAKKPKSATKDDRQPNERSGSEQSSKDTGEAQSPVDSSRLTLDDIGGLHSQRETLRQIAVSYLHPEVMEKWGAKRPNGVLLHGPPGTGKTMLIHALGVEMEAEVREIQSSDIYNKWVGKSEERIKQIFTEAAAYSGRLILFFDEFDAIIGTTSSDSAGGEVQNRVAGLFKQESTKLYEAKPDVLLAAATNDLERIDPALRRSGRFDHVLTVPLPDQAARLEIISAIMGKTVQQNESDDFQVYGDDVNVPHFAELMDGYSGADIAEIMRRLSFSKALEEVRLGSVQPISQADIEQAVQLFKQN